MREFVMTSNNFTGFVKFAYDDQNCLVKYENAAYLEDKQYTWLINHFPFTIDGLDKIQQSAKSCVIKEVTDLSFDTFWNIYGYKKGRLKAEAEWRKLTEGDKAKAIASINRYKYDCKRRNCEMVYAERYLKHRRFEDE